MGFCLLNNDLRKVKVPFRVQAGVKERRGSIPEQHRRSETVIT